MSLLRCLLSLYCLCAITAASAYNIVQPEYSLQRFLEANPSQQPLMEQLQAKVWSQPTPTSIQAVHTTKIAVALRGQSGEIKNKAWLMAFNRRLRELGLNYRADIFYLPRQESYEATTDIFKAIKAGQFDYIVMDGLDEYSRPRIERLLYQGDSKILMLGMAAPVKAWRYHPPLIYIGIDLPKAMHRLASYINHSLSSHTIVDVIMVSGAFDDAQRCQVFMNEWMSLGRTVNQHVSIANEAPLAFQAATDLIQHAKSDPLYKGQQHFIFSCTPEVSFGVLGAIGSVEGVMTNAWNGQDLSDERLHREHILVTVLDMYDNMAIATAEAIRADLESRLLPDIYMESSSLLFPEMDQETRNIMFQKAFRYSYPLWPQ